MKRARCERVEIQCKSGVRSIMVERRAIECPAKPAREARAAKIEFFAPTIANEISYMFRERPMRFPIILYGD